VGSAPPVCTARLDAALGPGECQRVQCSWKTPPLRSARLILRVADDGNSPRTAPAQCREDNDQDVLSEVTCFNAPP